MGGFYSTMGAPKPGPKEGSARPSGAPNNGNMGGRPPDPVPPGGGSPMETMAAGTSSFYPQTAPPMMGDTTAPSVGGPAPGVASGVGAAPSPAPSTAPAAPSGVTININSGGGGAAAPSSPQQAGGEIWPDATGQKPQSAGGEIWPDAQGPAGSPASPTPTTAGGEIWPDLAPPPPAVFKSAPTPEQMALVKEGADVVTPYGTGTKKAGKVDKYVLTPAGQEAHKRATLRLRERFGATPFDGGDPGAPEWPVQIGAWNFNPYSPPGKQWVK